jgi:glycosyltransferase involved in cell wall biosynthesis
MASHGNEPMTRVEISIVIGTFNRKNMLVNCIESIRSNDITVPYEMIVVDGGSDDGTPSWLLRQKDILTIVQHNRVTENGQANLRRSWGYFMNLGFKSAEGKYICMVSDDCYIHPDTIMNGYDLMEADTQHKIGACAFLFRDCFIHDQFFVYMFQEKVLVNHGIYRKEILQSLGWIDEEHFKFYFADTDLSLKIWDRGYHITPSLGSLIEHFRNDFNQQRPKELSFSKKTEDYITFKNLWRTSSGDEPSVQKIYFPGIRTDLKASYLPRGWIFYFLFLKTWLKEAIKQKHFLYRLLQKLKRKQGDRM